MILDLIEFIKFTHKFQKVQRQIYATGENRNENDAEHSYQIAIAGWYIVEKEKLNLDTNKVIKYALIHDLVEVYAGDTFFYHANKEFADNKEKKEREAAEKIKQEFSDFKEIYNLIQEYEKKSNEEAKFVYALDKILPVINVYLDKGKSWQKYKVTYEMARTKDEKVKVSPEIEKYWKEFVEILDKEKNEVFYTK